MLSRGMRCKPCNHAAQTRWRKNHADVSRECARRYRLNRIQTNPAHELIRSAKERATRLGIPFALDVSDIQIPDVCPVFGTPLSRGDGSHHAHSPSIDRVIPALGYVPGNVRVISRRANTIKNDATAEELAAVLFYVQQSIGEKSE